MSGSSNRTLSPWWGLLLLPVTLGGGWLMGRLPTPAAPAAGAVRVQTLSSEFSEWTTPDGATAESERNGKPILIDFNAEWCEPCQALKHGVFEDADYGSTVRKTVIPVSVVDRRREDGANSDQTTNLQVRFHVNAFPTVVVYSPATGKVRRTEGYEDADEMMRWIQESARAVR